MMLKRWYYCPLETPSATKERKNARKLKSQTLIKLLTNLKTSTVKICHQSTHIQTILALAMSCFTKAIQVSMIVLCKGTK